MVTLLCLVTTAFFGRCWVPAGLPVTGAPPDTATAQAEANRFDPSQIAVGDSILGLTVVSTAISPMGPDRYSGTVQFAGSVTVSGTYDPATLLPGAEVGIPCFFVDEASAQTLPRFAGDNRMVWFCFTNPEDVRADLGEVKRDGVAIAISDYETNFIPSDVTDTAKFVSLIPQE